MADRFGWITGGPLPSRFARWDTPATTYYVLQGAIALLVVVGLVMVLSSSFVESYDATEDSFGIGVRQAVFAVIGTVGLLLVSALMVVPVATAQQLTRSFRTTLAGAMLLGTLASVGGLLLSTYLSLHARVATGPTIVLLALAGFVVAWPAGGSGLPSMVIVAPKSSPPIGSVTAAPASITPGAARSSRGGNGRVQRTAQHQARLVHGAHLGVGLVFDTGLAESHGESFQWLRPLPESGRSLE